jgi:hypothetical protein
MASGTPDWCGQKVKAGNVIYLAGEGHHGLRSRVAAWKHQHQAGSLSMWLSKDGCDLNTSAGYVQVVEQIRKLDKYPSVIVVDTLHRFLSGDENSAQDAKTMLDACNHLMSEFSCSVILVHHTGVSEEAQHRARGSSAWRGALDIEISIVPAKDDKPMEIIQRKSKDAELAQPIYVNIEQVEIPGWFDEDGLPVTSAVIVQSEQTHQDNSTITQMSKQQKTNLSIFESSWWHHKTQEHNGYPYVSYKDMLLYLQTHRGHKEESAKQILKPSAKGKFISELLASGLVEEAADGWILADSTLASIWMMRKNDAA